MKVNHWRLSENRRHADFLSTMRRLILMVVAMLVGGLGQTGNAQSHAQAGTPVINGWNAEQQIIEHHPTWIFTPSTTLENGKRGLLIVLHGCMQTNTVLKEFGNLDTVAKNRGVVIAVPYVGSNNYGGPPYNCWNYDGAIDASGNMDDLIKLTKDIEGNVALNIDPNQVYLVGLSSGGAIALAIGCKAPQIFAGIGAISGPSVGSSQLLATSEPPSINVEVAVDRCRSLAQPNDGALATQITCIAYGDMDKDGPAEKFDYTDLNKSFDKKHPGQLAVISIHWSVDNVEILRQIYYADSLGPKQDVQNGLATQQVALKDGKERIALLVSNNIGHAWPAGTGRADTKKGGLWIAQRGIDYPDYVMGWFLRNNLRAGVSTSSSQTQTSR
ncbi:PHB depolymerase family esterase [Paraburkholderia sp. BR14263]|uniref:alpha/beta hydrolase family esterase n=1 Tax=unclassified Paraburkholderia TaxID=2615204 RepID=UPI0034CE9291